MSFIGRKRFFDSNGVEYVPDSEEEGEEEEGIDKQLPELSSGEENTSRPRRETRPCKPALQSTPIVSLKRASDTLILDPIETSSAEVSQLIVLDSHTSTDLLSEDMSQASLTCVPPSSPLGRRFRDLEPSLRSDGQSNKKRHAQIRPIPSPATSPKHDTLPAVTFPWSDVSRDNERRYTSVQSPNSTPTKRSGVPTSAGTSSSRRTPKKQAELPLAEYAEALFKLLNATVFNGGISDDTKIIWNQRLTRTAGRANFRQKQDGSRSSSVELSPKVVDRKVRVRNTLAHELCHLAVWTIDCVMDNTHGEHWAKWANKVMAVHDSISISPKHTYEVICPFNWECVECGIIFGRHTNSIDIEKMVCVCHGELQFLERRPRALDIQSEETAIEASPRPIPRVLLHDSCPLSILSAASTGGDEEYKLNKLISGINRVELKDD